MQRRASTLFLSTLAIPSIWMLSSCAQPTANLSATAAETALNIAPSYEWDVLSAIDPAVIKYQAKSVVFDSKSGAIGSNRQSYQSVGYQRYSSNLIIYGLVTRNTSLVEAGIKVAEYAFAHQNEDGSFEDNSTKTGVSTPTSVAFFLQDLGRSLLLCEQSSWFQTSQKTDRLRIRLNQLLPLTNRSLDWLMKQQAELIKGDGAGRATNRLFFDSLAFYLTGKALRSNRAVAVGEQFAKLALQQQAEAGFFLENRGQDSSYQGVSLSKALLLLTNLKPESSGLRRQLWLAIQKGVEWQLSSVLQTGEISADGNTRVYPGGEIYLKKEKKIDYLASVLALNYYSAISRNRDVQSTANRILLYYRTGG